MVKGELPDPLEEDVVARLDEIIAAADSLDDVEIPEDEVTEQAMRKKQVDVISLKMAIKVAMALTKAQLDDEEKAGLKMKEAGDYDAPNMTNNAWNIFYGLYDVQTNGVTSEQRYLTATQDPQWENFVSQNGDLIQKLLAVIKVSRLFQPLRRVAIESMFISDREEPSSLERTIDTLGYTRGEYFFMRRRELLMIEALQKMEAAGMTNPGQYCG